MKNVYELMMEMVAMESEINKLNDDLSKASNDADKVRISTEIDRRYADMLTKKHILERIEVSVL